MMKTGLQCQWWLFFRESPFLSSALSVNFYLHGRPLRAAGEGTWSLNLHMNYQLIICYENCQKIAMGPEWLKNQWKSARFLQLESPEQVWLQTEVVRVSVVVLLSPSSWRFFSVLASCSGKLSPTLAWILDGPERGPPSPNFGSDGHWPKDQ